MFAAFILKEEEEGCHNSRKQPYCQQNSKYKHKISYVQ